jgi:hypothetical protein
MRRRKEISKGRIGEDEGEERRRREEKERNNWKQKREEEEGNGIEERKVKDYKMEVKMDNNKRRTRREQ